MKLLLDENLPKKLKYRFNDNFEVFTVPEMGWSGIKNGELLDSMSSKNFSVLISLDKNMSYQQNLEHKKISLIVFDVKDALYDTLVDLIPKLEERLSQPLKPGLTIIN